MLVYCYAFNGDDGPFVRVCRGWFHAEINFLLIHDLLHILIIVYPFQNFLALAFPSLLQQISRSFKPIDNQKQHSLQQGRNKRKAKDNKPIAFLILVVVIVGQLQNVLQQAGEEDSECYEELVECAQCPGDFDWGELFYD